MTTSLRMRRAPAALLSMLLAGVTAPVLAAAPVAAAPLPNQAPVAVASANPNPADVGDVVTFDGTGSSDAETTKDALSYEWTFHDGSTATGFRVTKQFVRAGVYPVTLRVTDEDGASDTEEVTVNVDDTAPVARATATPTSAKVEQAVAFDGSGSRDAETPKEQLAYAWDFRDGQTASGINVAHAFQASGTYDVVLTVTDPHGATSTAEVKVTVTNTAPTAEATVTPNPGRARQSITFDGSPSSDPETTDDRLFYAWDFGDGGETVDARGKVVEHAYDEAGAKIVTLTVTDPQGAIDTTQVLVMVQPNSAPTAVAKATPTAANLDDDIEFDGSQSSDAETPQDQLAFSWDFGDGGSTVDATTPVVTYPGYTTPGEKTATLTVTDAQGNSATDTVNVSVGNTRPVADAAATPNPAKVDNAVAFDGTGSSDAETPANQLKYEWDFGDGTPKATTPTAQHVYGVVGTYTVTLRVKDAVGAVATDTITLQVTNSAPSAAFTATPNPTTATRNVLFDASGTTDGESDRSRLTFEWDFGDGGSTTDASGPVVTKAFPAAGAHQVTLTVRDPHGGADTATTLLGVLGNTGPTANATATPSPAKVAQAVTFDGSRSADTEDDADKEPLAYRWTFPDGSTSTGRVVTKTFSTAGAKEVTLEVTDSGGLTATRELSVEVTNTAPVAEAIVTGPLLIGKTLVFDGSRSRDAETPDALTYVWEFGDGTTGEGVRPRKRYAEPGSYVARLTVTDPQGLTATDTVRVDVARSISCRAGAVTRRGSWRVVESAAATGGSYCDNLGSRRGADTMRLDFEGPRAAVTFARAAAGGVAKVYVDGELVGKVDFGADTRRPRFGYTRTFTGLGASDHRLKLVMVRGAGYVDDFLVWGDVLS